MSTIPIRITTAYLNWSCYTRINLFQHSGSCRIPRSLPASHLGSHPTSRCPANCPLAGIEQNSEFRNPENRREGQKRTASVAETILKSGPNINAGSELRDPKVRVELGGVNSDFAFSHNPDNICKPPPVPTLFLQVMFSISPSKRINSPCGDYLRSQICPI